LTMPPAHARSAIAALIRYWTNDNSVSAVIAVAHHQLEDGRHLLKGFLAKAGDAHTEAIAELCDCAEEEARGRIPPRARASRAARVRRS
jgi:hypothetical protein